MTPFLPDDERLAAVREALPATAAGIYLNTGSVGPLPTESHRAMTELADWELRVGRSTEDYWQELLQRMDEARAGVAAIGGVDPAAIALAHSTTEAMTAAVWAIDWRAGDRAVTTPFEHGGGLASLSTVRDRLGVELVVTDLGDDGDDERTLAALDAAIVPGTRLISISHVAPATGARLPIARIVELAHGRDALVAVDGAQAFGAIPVDLGQLGVDFYAIAAQKWLLGPEGMAALYVAPAARHPDAVRLETVGFHRPSVVGMARSIAWLSMYVGWDWIHARGPALAQAAADRLARIPGVELTTPRERMATLVSFRIPGWPLEAAFDEISRRSFAIFRSLPAVDSLQISVGFFNTGAELERFAETVELVAGHTPDSLPPRRTLTILGEGDG